MVKHMKAKEEFIEEQIQKYKDKVINKKEAKV